MPGSPDEADADAGTTPRNVSGSPQDQIERWRGVIDRMRLQTDLAAKGLAAIGSTVLAAVGIAKVADLFPLPHDADRWTVVAIVATTGGFALMAAAVAAFTIRLTRVSSPVFVQSSSERIDEVDREERAQVDAIFADMARLNGAPSLSAYEARARRLDRIAERAEPTRRAQLQREAATIRTEVQATLGQAAADIIRSRATHCLTDRGAKGWYAVATAGLVLFGGGADYLDGQRAGRTAMAKDVVAVARECAALQKAYSDQKRQAVLPEGCPTPAAAATAAADTTSDPSPSGEVAGALQDLADRYAACVAAVESPADDRACDQIRALIRRGSEPTAG